MVRGLRHVTYDKKLRECLFTLRKRKLRGNLADVLSYTMQEKKEPDFSHRCIAIGQGTTGMSHDMENVNWIQGKKNYCHDGQILE